MINFKKLLVSAGAFTALLGMLTTSAFAQGQVGTVNASSLNIREGASTSSAVVAKAAQGAQVNILESYNGWYKITSGDATGWVSGNYITVSQEAVKGMITSDNVNVRTGPGSSYDVILSVLSEGVDVIDAEGDWYKVRFSTGLEGWIHSDYVNTGDKKVASRGTSSGNQITEYAKKFLGVKYVWGGNSSKGVDCSGFTKLVYGSNGIDLNRVAADQASQGTKINASNLKPGDLVFFDTNGGKNYINHVGIYLGDGQFIHASSGAGKVTTSSLTTGFYANTYMTARTFSR